MIYKLLKPEMTLECVSQHRQALAANDKVADNRQYQTSHWSNKGEISRMATCAGKVFNKLGDCNGES